MMTLPYIILALSFVAAIFMLLVMAGGKEEEPLDYTPHTFSGIIPPLDIVEQLNRELNVCVSHDASPHVGTGQDVEARVREIAKEELRAAGIID